MVGKCNKCKHKGSLVCYICNDKPAPHDDREAKKLMGHDSYKRKSGSIKQVRWK